MGADEDREDRDSKQYRLGPLRESRQRDERVRRNDLAVAVGDAHATELAVAETAARVAAARSRLDQAVRGRNALNVTGAGQLALADRHVERCRRDLERALDEQRRASRAHDDKLGAIDEARSKLAAARADREVIERHFARWRDDRKRLAERRED